MRRCTRGRCWVRSRVFRGELFCLASLCCWVCVCLGFYRAAYSFSMLFRFLFVWGSIGLRIASGFYFINAFDALCARVYIQVYLSGLPSVMSPYAGASYAPKHA
jgi:hypothetical protein